LTSIASAAPINGDRKNLKKSLAMSHPIDKTDNDWRYWSRKSREL